LLAAEPVTARTVIAAAVILTAVIVVITAPKADVSKMVPQVPAARKS
jgi:hypothetical protein